MPGVTRAFQPLLAASAAAGAWVNGTEVDAFNVRKIAHGLGGREVTMQRRPPLAPVFNSRDHAREETRER